MTTITVMGKSQPFALIYDPEITKHLAAIESKYHSLIRSTIEEQLRFEPETSTRNRKRLERPTDLPARWELRFGPDNRIMLGVNDDEELERLLLAHSPKLRAILDAAERRIDEGKGIGHDELWHQVESANRAREANGNGKKRRSKR